MMYRGGGVKRELFSKKWKNVRGKYILLFLSKNSKKNLQIFFHTSHVRNKEYFVEKKIRFSVFLVYLCLYTI